MSTHFKELGESNKEALSSDLRVRWAYLEESLRLELASGVERLRKVLGLSQKQLAERSQTTQPMLSRFLSGDDSRSPTLETLVKLADALDSQLVVGFANHADVEQFSWDRVPTVAAPTGTSWDGVVEGAVQPASAMRRWNYQRPVAEAGCENLAFCP